MKWIAPSEKDAANSTLEKRLWDAADQFRANSGLKAQEYSGPILGLIFLRFAEVRFAAQRAKLEKTSASSRRGSRIDDPNAYHAEGILYLPPEARFDYLLHRPEAENIGAKVNDAMRVIEKDNPQLAGVLPKTYNLFTSTLLKELLKRVSEIPASVDYDAFGRIYEYFLGEFARTEGQKGGEFYTPGSIVRLITEILEPYQGRILDPACGSGGTRDDRLETVAEDIVRHFLGRGFQGKAMVVSIDKATALRMYNKVRKYWVAELAWVKADIQKLTYPTKRQAKAAAAASPDELAELHRRKGILESTDMAVIVSPGQNEIEQMKKLDLDILPHRKRINDSQPPLDEKFKDPDDPLRLVFVCAMWLTGFDAPSCSTVYLDKPMRNHTLMQTIARANRVYPGKHSGVIVDYANVFASLEKALAIYGAGKGGANPVQDKAKLVEELRKALEAAIAFCAKHQVDVAGMERLPAGNMQRLKKLDDAVNALISPDPLRREFFGHERLVSTLFNAIKPDPAVLEFAGRVACISAIAAAIRAKLNPEPADITGVMQEINAVLDRSITGVEMPATPAAILDLSKIDFAALAKKFKAAKHKNTEIEVLKAAIRAQIEKLIRLNKTRADFAEKFEQLIESYNAGSRNIEELFEELLKLSRSLNEEQQRHVRENMSEEELVILDILTRPAPELNDEERAEVKKVARELLTKLKGLLVISWRQKAGARSQVKIAIEDLLDTGLPRKYSPELYQQKCSAVFEHVFESYPERGKGTYEEAG